MGIENTKTSMGQTRWSSGELSGTCHRSGPMPPRGNVDPVMPTLIFPEKPAMWILIRTLLLMKWFHKLRPTHSTHTLSYQEVIRYGHGCANLSELPLVPDGHEGHHCYGLKHITLPKSLSSQLYHKLNITSDLITFGGY